MRTQAVYDADDPRQLRALSKDYNQCTCSGRSTALVVTHNRARARATKTVEPRQKSKWREGIIKSELPREDRDGTIVSFYYRPTVVLRKPFR